MKKYRITHSCSSSEFAVVLKAHSLIGAYAYFRNVIVNINLSFFSTYEDDKKLVRESNYGEKIVVEEI